MSQVLSGLKGWIAPSRTALLLVDCQVDFAAPEGAMARRGYDITAPMAALHKAALLANAARQARVPCLFARLITRPGDGTPMLREWAGRRGWDPSPCREDSSGAEFVSVTPLEGEAVFSKRRYNAFVGTNLDVHLRGLGRDTLVIAGLTTECCVDSTARDAFERDYHVIIASDAVAAYEKGLHDWTLKALELNCAVLATCEDIAAVWK
ncbi:MAG TPA: isochorismatase family cysteine hydrolase [Rhizomicrobium sp.]|nr:isochorismatase family cysteine hydrolase [Rhizomicrobium sp.]